MREAPLYGTIGARLAWVPVRVPCVCLSLLPIQLEVCPKRSGYERGSGEYVEAFGRRLRRALPAIRTRTQVPDLAQFQSCQDLADAREAKRLRRGGS